MNSPTPLLLRFYPNIISLWVRSLFHISTLTSNYISCTIDSNTARIPRINSLQVVDHKRNLVIF